MVFDKTGTLTNGTLVVQNFIDVCKKFKQPQKTTLTSEQVIQLLFKSESLCEHPIAKAIMAKLLNENPDIVEKTNELSIQSCEAIDGCGIEATMSSSVEPEACFKVVCGNISLMQRNKIDLSFNRF